ncbi:MAG: DUF6503 family protein [Bacteroidota bacterium]
MNKLYLILLLFVLACDPPTDTENNTIETPNTNLMPNVLQAGLNSHGGLENWRNMRTLEYDFQKDSATMEHQMIDLQNRKVLLGTDDYKVGFDGKEVWVSPNKAAFGKMSARFYHNLRFYFFALPFLAADPGISYELMPDKTLNGETYDAVKLTYDDNVGDAPEDEYILCFDKNSHQMEWLLYTVTYFTGEKASKYNALHYADWTEVNGLLFPKTMSGYTFENDTIGTKRYDRNFKNIQISSEVPNQDMFEMPEGAEVDYLNAED